MATLRRWWNRLLGRTPAPAATPRAATQRPAAASAPPVDTGDLELLDGPPKPRPKRIGQAGFDPYGNDAGYSKPRGWERVDRD